MRVIIGTPCYDGKLSAFYVSSLVETIRNCPQDIQIFPIFLSYDALIQRARNDLIAMALDHSCDALVFIDSDMEWQPEWIFRLLNYKEDVVGGTCRKKTDDAELYNISTQNLAIGTNGLILVDSLGTGFIKINRRALVALWAASPEYSNEGKIRRMVCNVEVVDGELVSEDVDLSRKLVKLGFGIYLDPTMTCGHIGVKKFVGDFMEFLGRIGGDK